jgi:hypothetical protein
MVVARMKNLLAFICAVPLSAIAQVTISGVILDTATGVGVPNAVVSLVPDASIIDTTDAYGNFTLGGTPSSVANGKAHQTVQDLIAVSGDKLEVSGALESDVTGVDVYNAAGIRTYSARQNAGENVGVYAGLWRAPGFYYIKVRSSSGDRSLACFAAGNGLNRLLSGAVEGKSLGKTAATYTINVAKPGYATKQVSGVIGAASSDTIKVQAVQVPHPVTPMPIISQNVPAYASSNQSGAPLANDTDQSHSWQTTATTGWLAYDLSSKPLSARHQVLVAWYDQWAGDYFYYNGVQEMQDYTIEINMAAGGGACPTTGWVTVLSVTGNTRNSRQHEINMEGANWIRINVSTSNDPTGFSIDMDVYDVSKGITDCWLIMGDSITFMYMQRNGNSLQNSVHSFNSSAWPVQAIGAEGGTGSHFGDTCIAHVLAEFPGRFITINWGTNDALQEWNTTYFNLMDTICMKIIAAGRTPVLPTVPWAQPTSKDTNETKAKVDTVYKLYAKYPTQVLPGPDLYTFFKSNPTLMSDIHPTGVGGDSLRALWVRTFDSLYVK